MNLILLIIAGFPLFSLAVVYPCGPAFERMTFFDSERDFGSAPSSPRLRQWLEKKPAVRQESVKRVIGFMMETGRMPASKKELGEIVGFSFNKLVGLSTYAKGKELSDFAVYDDPAELKAAVTAARQAAIDYLERKKEKGLSSLETKYLDNLKAAPIVSSRDGILTPGQRVDVARANNWTVERPKAQRRAVKNIIAFIGSHGRVPDREREIGAAAGVGYSKLTGQDKYAPGQSSDHLAIFTDKEEFRQAWTLALQAEIKRMRTIGPRAALSPQHARYLANLEAVTPTDLPDGMKTRIPPFQRDQGALAIRLAELRSSCRIAIVDFMAREGRHPMLKELASITGVGEDRLLGRGRWAEGTTRRKYAIYENLEALEKDWARELARRLDDLRAKATSGTLTPEEKSAYEHLLNIP